MASISAAFTAPGKSSEGRDGTRPEARLAQALGWFSLGLGSVQLVAPGAVNRLIGVRDDTKARVIQRMIGLQELSAAAGILPRARPLGWFWSRTSGDVLHLGLLLRAWAGRRESTPRLTAAIGSIVGCLVADGFTAVR